MTSDVPVRKQRSLASRILINAMSGAGNRVATMAIGFLLTPIIIGALGLSQYGMWSVIGTLAQYLGLLDFGVGGAFVKFITEYVERDDRASARQVVVFGVVFYAAFGIVLAAPVLLFAPHLIHLFKMPAQQYAEGANVLRVFFGMLIVFMIVNVPGMVVVSMQRMDLASRNNFISYCAYAAVTVVLLKLHFGISGILIGQGVQLAVISILHVGTARRLFGPLWHNPFAIDRAIINRLFSFGGWSQLTSILSAVNQDVGRFVGAGAVNVAGVAVYEIANKPSFFARIFPAYLLGALMPPLAAADARGDRAALERMYASGTRFAVFVSLAFAGIAIGGADPLIRVWLGKAYPQVSTLVFWLATGYAISSFSGVGTTLYRASGKPRRETAYMAVASVGTVAATLVLVRPFGIVGVAMGTTVGWLAATIYFIASFHRTTPANWWATIGWPAARMVLSSGIAVGAFYAIVHLAPVARVFEHRFVGLVLFVALTASYLATFVALTFLFRVWSHDREQIDARFGAVRLRFERSVLRLQGHQA